MVYFLLIFAISFPCLSQDIFGNNPLNEITPLDQETPQRRAQRAISMAQRAVFTYSVPRKIKRRIEKKFTELMGKEFGATLGAFYIAFNNKEVSTRYIKNITIPYGGGSIRPDLGYQITTKNTYGGLYFIRSFP